jgi:hypothetical protein
MMSFENPGRHSVKVAAHMLGRSGTGTHHVAVLFEDEAGDRITWYGYLSDKAIERTVASLQVLGWDPAEHGGRIDSLNGTDLLVDADAEIVVENEEYEGKVRPKVKWVNAPGGGMGEAMDAVDADVFAASLRAKVLSAAKPTPNGAPGPAKRPEPAAAGGAIDDDLPFAPLGEF